MAITMINLVPPTMPPSKSSWRYSLPCPYTNKEENKSTKQHPSNNALLASPNQYISQARTSLLVLLSIRSAAISTAILPSHDDSFSHGEPLHPASAGRSYPVPPPLPPHYQPTSYLRDWACKGHPAAQATKESPKGGEKIQVALDGCGRAMGDGQPCGT